MDNEVTNILSPKEQQVMANILSIQDFYQLKDHMRLISIIVNRKESEKFFSSKKVMISDVFESQNQIISDEEKINIFAEKYTYENLVEKFKKPRAFKNNILVQILQKKMRTQTISSHQTRKKIWLLASGALFSMNNNKGLFQGLITYPDYPSYYDRSIGLDLPRTVKRSQTSEDQIKALKNVLLAFSRRNPYIGYCQGLNFVAFFLLTMQFTEEECFWILSQIIETVIPMDYYTNMIGVACDQKIFLDILKILKPQITKKFEEVGFDGSVLSIQWFVCLFTSSLPFYLVKVVWDRLLVDGTIAFIKCGIIILSYFEAEIMKANEFYQIIQLIQEGSKNLKLDQNQFNKEFDKLYVNVEGLKIARDLYRQFHLKDRLAQKVIPKKIQKRKCDPQWPICTDFLEKCKANKIEVEIWTYRQEGSPKLIHDYLQSKSESKIVGSTIIADKNSVKNKKVEPNEYVMGRIEHSCVKDQGEQKIWNKRIKKDRRNVQFLSMVLEENEEDEKKVENLKKLLRLSSVQENNGNENEEKKKFQRSETILFYNKFVQDHSEIAEMLVSKKK